MKPNRRPVAGNVADSFLVLITPANGNVIEFDMLPTMYLQGSIAKSVILLVVQFDRLVAPILVIRVVIQGHVILVR